MEEKKGTFKEIITSLIGEANGEGKSDFTCYKYSSEVYTTNFYGDLTAFDCLYEEAEKLGKFEYENTIASNFFAFFTLNEGGYLEIYFLKDTRKVGLIYVKNRELMPDYLGSKKPYKGEKGLAQITPDYQLRNFGNCYVFVLGEGHFAVYDCLADRSNDDEQLYNFMVSKTPKGKKPTIDAFILTHPHWDHVCGFYRFCENYCDKVDCLNIIYSHFDLDAVPHREDEENDHNDSDNKWIKRGVEAFKNAKVYRAHIGQAPIIGGMKTEFLYTGEILFPYEPRKFEANDISLVTMVTSGKTKALMAADIMGRVPCERIGTLYDEYLRSDVYQIAHHGWQSFAMSFLPYVQPKYVFQSVHPNDLEAIKEFPQTAYLNERYKNGESVSLYTKEHKTVYLPFEE